MPDNQPTNRITMRDLYDKQVAIEALMQQVLLKLSEFSTGDIMKDRNTVDKSNPYWDEDKQAYSRKHYLENHPIEKGEK